MGTLDGPIEMLALADDMLVVAAPYGAVEALYLMPAAGGSPSVVASLGIASKTPQGEYPQGVYGLVVRDQVAYVSVIGYPPNESIIASVDLTSRSVTQLSVGTLSLPVTQVAVDDAFVYFADYIDHAEPAIWRVSISGNGAPQAVIPTPNYCSSCGFTTPLAVDGTNLYFTTDEFGATLAAWPTAGGTPVTIAAGTNVNASISGVASDDTCIYWVAEGDGNVYAAPK